MKVGDKGLVCGRIAKIVAIYPKSIRVLYLEQSMRGKMLDLIFVPFEDNVPKEYWYNVPWNKGDKLYQDR